jgi:hypothetical protein
MMTIFGRNIKEHLKNREKCVKKVTLILWSRLYRLTPTDNDRFMFVRICGWVCRWAGVCEVMGGWVVA